jgi:hypothetical protein
MERGEDGADDYAGIRERRAALRTHRPKFLKRYLTVVGVIFAVIIALGLWLKPPAERMQQAVDIALAEYVRAKTGAGEPAPVVTSTETRDWIVAVSHVARIGEETFSCVGGFKVTFCFSPDAE